MSKSSSNSSRGWVHPDVLSDLRSDGRLDSPIVSSFAAAYEQLSDSTDEVIIPKDCIEALSEYGFEQSSLALQCGATQTYRDQADMDSVQLWEYGRYYVARMNEFNPDQGRLVEHVLADKSQYVVGASVVAALGYGLYQWKQSGADDTRRQDGHNR